MLLSFPIELQSRPMTTDNRATLRIDTPTLHELLRLPDDIHIEHVFIEHDPPAYAIVVSSPDFPPNERGVAYPRLRRSSGRTSVDLSDTSFPPAGGNDQLVSDLRDVSLTWTHEEVSYEL